MLLHHSRQGAAGKAVAVVVKAAAVKVTAGNAVAVKAGAVKAVAPLRRYIGSGNPHCSKYRWIHRIPIDCNRGYCDRLYSLSANRIAVGLDHHLQTRPRQKPQ